MRTISEKIFDVRSGESEPDYRKRVEEAKTIFQAALGGANGKRLLNLLAAHSHPMAPRFGEGKTPEEAAFLDGERSFLATLILNSSKGPVTGDELKK